MITVHIPTFSYTDRVILHNISLSLKTGEVYGVVGLNGAGKTTFFQLLGGFLKTKNASLLKNGQPVPRKAIAYMDTELFFYPKLTAHEFLSVFPATNTAYKEEALAELFVLPLNGLIEEFSTGMKKKLLLLSQIKQDKDIYIFDEPFNGLDLETNKLLEVIISILAGRGKTIFISSHILDPLIHICHSIHYLKEQTLFKSYSQAEFGSVSEDLFGKYTRELEEKLVQMI